MQNNKVAILPRASQPPSTGIFPYPCLRAAARTPRGRGIRQGSTILRSRFRATPSEPATASAAVPSTATNRFARAGNRNKEVSTANIRQIGRSIRPACGLASSKATISGVSSTARS